MDIVKTRKPKLEELELNTQGLQNQDGSELRDSVRVERAYQEIPGLRHETKDVLKQMQNNVLLLEDLIGRLSYVAGEVRSLIRR